MSRRNPIDIPQGLSFYDYGQETLILERTDDVITASYEPVKVYDLNGIAVTGIQNAADYLGVHANTIRRYAENGYLDSARLPSGVRRIKIESLKSVHDQMFSGIE